MNPRPEEDERITLRLTGSEAQHGLPWENLAGFVDEIRRALREHDRQRQGARAGRGGHPSGREELVTSFRLVRFLPGSAIMELEPIAADVADESQETLGEVETLSVENLRAFIDTLESDSIVDPVISQAVEGARRQLGDDGKIEISVGPPKHPSRHTIIDADTVAALAARGRRATSHRMTVSGRLHMVDVEPGKLAIRAGDGTDWVCSYPSEMEDDVAALVRQRVWARGVGTRQSASRGKLELDEIRPIERPVQSPLFVFERLPLADLIADQGITGPQGLQRLLPDDVDDEELDAFVDALLEH